MNGYVVTGRRDVRRSVKSDRAAEDASGAAVTTMLKIMLDLMVPAETRLRAHGFGDQSNEIEDIEAHVAALEYAVLEWLSSLKVERRSA
jgi:hypothetical protein